MPGIAIVIIAVIVVIAVIAGKKSYDTSKRLAGEGKISARRSAFFEDKEIFETSASYEAICQKIKETNLADTNATIQFDFEGGKTIFFQSAGMWNAVLEQCGQKDGKNLFQFYFPVWKTGRYANLPIMTAK